MDWFYVCLKFWLICCPVITLETLLIFQNHIQNDRRFRNEMLDNSDTEGWRRHVSCQGKSWIPKSNMIRLNLVKLWFSKNTKFNNFFQWSKFIMVNFIIKLPPECRFYLKTPHKNAKNRDFWKMKNLCFWLDLFTFLWPKTAYYIAFWSHTKISHCTAMNCIRLSALLKTSLKSFRLRKLLDQSTLAY